MLSNLLRKKTKKSELDGRLQERMKKIPLREEKDRMKKRGNNQAGDEETGEKMVQVKRRGDGNGERGGRGRGVR